jgi:hypothetical protein
MTTINMTNDASYNFVAPTIEADACSKVEVVFPTSEAQVLTPAAEITATVQRSTTIIDCGQLTANANLDLTITPDVPVGASLTVKMASDTTARTLTLGNGFVGNPIVGTPSNTFVTPFVFDGTNFIATGAPVAITNVVAPAPAS